MQSNIQTYFRLIKRETLIALGLSVGGWGLNFCIHGVCICCTSPQREIRFEHPHLAEVVSNCLVTFYDMRSE